jgi:hypothetical protein
MKKSEVSDPVVLCAYGKPLKLITEILGKYGSAKLHPSGAILTNFQWTASFSDLTACATPKDLESALKIIRKKLTKNYILVFFIHHPYNRARFFFVSISSKVDNFPQFEHCMRIPWDENVEQMTESALDHLFIETIDHL